MFTNTTRRLALILVCGGVTALVAQQPRRHPAPAPTAAPPRAVQAMPAHAVIGTLKALDTAAATMTLATSDRPSFVLKFTPGIRVSGLKPGAKMHDLVGKEGATLVVHFKGDTVATVAASVDFIAMEALRTTEGSLVRVHLSERRMVIKTARGAEETFELAPRTTIETEQGVIGLAALAAKPGQQVALFYSERGGRKTVRFVKQIEKAVALR